jgi:thiamine biosynthesis lipoprotein
MSEPSQASDVLFDAVSLARAWAERTEGVFDPTVLRALEACGYDRTFDEIVVDDEAAQVHPCDAQRWREIELDRERRAIALGGDFGIDLGGIGKGFTVDRAIDALGPGANAMVNASGDLYAAGAGPEGHGWLVGVQDPSRPEEDLCVLRVANRGVATSGAGKRNWRRGDERYHHLIDTRAMRPSASGALSATIVAEDATTADVLAKVAFLLGPGAALDMASEFGAGCLIVDERERLTTNAAFEEYLA